jgi:hypothetical protein
LLSRSASFGADTTPRPAVDQVHDEIKVYNAEVKEVGQWSCEQHLNFAAIGQKQPEFPGGFTSNHSLQGTPEFAYSLTNWWEAGFYLPFAVSGSSQFRNLFYGINFELGYELPPFALSQSPWALEIRPIIGFATRKGSSSSTRLSASGMTNRLRILAPSDRPPQIRERTHDIDETMDLTIGPSVELDPVPPTTPG